jgi:uncharacterized membrane protein
MNKKFLSGVLSGFLFLAVFAVSGCGGSASDGGGDSAMAVETFVDEDVVIDESKVTGEARFYPAEVDGTKLEVIAVRASDGTVRTAFNTCQVCYSSGRGYYEQEGDILVCQNCGNQFSMDQVEVEAGGCNPVPIFEGDKKTSGNKITIPLTYLKSAKEIFANWKN